MLMQGEHTSLGFNKREEDPEHPKKTRMRPACPWLSLPLSPWPKRMTGQRAQGPAEHAPVGSGAQRARGMMEGRFRRRPRGAECANPRLCTARRGVQRGYVCSRHDSCAKSSAGGGRKACARAGCPVPGPRDAGRRARHIQQGMPKFQLSEILNRVLFRLM